MNEEEQIEVQNALENFMLGIGGVIEHFLDNLSGDTLNYVCDYEIPHPDKAGETITMYDALTLVGRAESIALAVGKAIIPEEANPPWSVE